MAPHFWNPPADGAAWRKRLQRRRRALIASDFDGTLSPLTADPWAARPTPGGLRALARLARLPETWAAVVSGRGLADLRGRCPAPGVWLVGSHGNEIAAPDGQTPAHSPTAPIFPASALEEIRRQIRGWPGVLADVKAAACALHYRQAPEFAAGVETLAARLADAYGLRLMPGKCLVELFCPGARDKGQAIGQLREHLGAETVVYFGDDRTDETVFALKAQWLIGVFVAPEANREATECAAGEAALDTGADYWVRGPEEVARALREIALCRRSI